MPRKSNRKPKPQKGAPDPDVTSADGKVRADVTALAIGCRCGGTITTEAGSLASTHSTPACPQYQHLDPVAFARWLGGQWPRRASIDQLSAAEAAIRAAVDAVEAMPPDVRLTDAVALLQRARDSVADYVDGVPRREPEGR